MGAGRATNEAAFNFFRLRSKPDLCCAVPKDRPVPSFLRGDWTYAGTARGATGFPRGFDRTAAQIGVALNGFHLFQSAEANRRTRIQTRHAAAITEPELQIARAALTAMAADGQRAPWIAAAASRVPANSGRAAVR
jgi:hypothetical protein